jgi:multicomponent Na+:H+ antiporter subunit F
MQTFLVATSGFVMLTVAVGLLRILYGPGDADRVMAAQLLGTGGVAALLLISLASSTPAVTDVAIALALLAAFATVAFAKYSAARPGGAHRDVDANRIGCGR